MKLLHPPTPLPARVRLLSQTHVFFLLLSTLLALINQAEATIPILSICAGGILAEWSGKRWNNELISYTLLLLTAGSAALIVEPEHKQACIMIFVACWILVPSKPGMLRLIALQQLILLAIPGIMSFTASLLLIPICLSALAADTWLRNMLTQTIGRSCLSLRSPHSSVQLWSRILSFIIPITLLSCSFGYGIDAGWTSYLASRQSTSEQFFPKEHASNSLSEHIRLDDTHFQDKNPALMARINYGEIQPPTVAYLRARSLPEIHIEKNEIGWRSPAEQLIQQPETVLLHNGHSSQAVSVAVLRSASRNTVFFPDGSAQVHRINTWLDSDNNLYAHNFSSSLERYTSDAGSAHYPCTELKRIPLYTIVPYDIERALSSRLPQLETWRLLPAQEAAHAICNWIHSRASYSLENLPKSGGHPANTMLTFLFGTDEERHGHCQYFSTACTLLLRMSGFAARPVTGFSSTERIDHIINFRAMHAHAWVEVLDDTNDTWHRIESTPSGYIDLRGDRSVINENDPLTTQREIDDDPFAQAALAHMPWWSQWHIITPLATFFFLIGVLVITASRRKRKICTQTRFILSQQQQTLHDLAIESGLQIQASTTITHIVTHIEQQTGISLQQPLQAYLNARFGTAEAIPDWPLAEIRNQLPK